VTEMAARPEKCVHYWIIEPPHGPTSKGRCRYCGTVAEFFNDLQGCLNNSRSYASGAYGEHDIVLDEDSIMVDNS
jgi:hypothetical protein